MKNHPFPHLKAQGTGRVNLPEHFLPPEGIVVMGTIREPGGAERAAAVYRSFLYWVYAEGARDGQEVGADGERVAAWTWRRAAAAGGEAA